MDKRAKLQKIIEYDGEMVVVRIKDIVFRAGYCSRCGMCCKTVGMSTRGSQAVIDWLRLHNVDVRIIGPIVTDSREQASEHTLSITYPCECKELIFDREDQKYLCNIYDDRPTICRGYPRKTSSHTPCTFVFLGPEDLKWFTENYKKYWREEHGQEKKIRLVN